MLVVDGGVAAAAAAAVFCGDRGVPVSVGAATVLSGSCH